MVINCLLRQPIYIESQGQSVQPDFDKARLREHIQEFPTLLFPPIQTHLEGK